MISGNRHKFKRTFRRWVRGFIIVFGILILVFATAVGILVGYIKTLPPIEQLENYSPPQATILYDRTGKSKIAAFARQNRVVVPLDQMPRNLKNAFIAVEDKRFYSHFGVDILRTFKALLINIRRGRVAQGASTITQQLPRNLLSSVSRKKILSRKIRETILAFQIERRYSKDQILEFYLNQIYLGNGAYGVQAAARTFFNKDISGLSLAESAVLAGIPQLPYRYSPINNIEASFRRRNIVLTLMLNQGVITKTQYEDASTTPIKVMPAPEPVNHAPYFVEHVRRTLIKTGEVDNESLFRDGYEIFTTLDMELQKIVDEELRKGLRSAEILRYENAMEYQLPLEQRDFKNAPPVNGQRRLAKLARMFSDTLHVTIGDYNGTIPLPSYAPYYESEEILKPGKWVEVIPTEVYRGTKTFYAELSDKKRLQGAAVILDAHTGEILALSGGENFYDFDNNGQWNRAAQGRGRQPGSAIKPLFFACAFDSGYSLTHRIDDRPIVFKDGYSPRNYENQYFGMTTLEEALEHSRNVVTVFLYQELKPDKALPFVQKFDVLEDAPEWILARDPTVALGSTTVKPLSLTAAYLPFANKGLSIRPLPVTRVIGPDKKSALTIKRFEREVLSPEAAFITTYALKGVIERGTGKKTIGQALEGMKVPEMAGKTGTTNDFVDSWFVGYTPDLVICVWVGFDDNRSLGENMTGSKAAAPIWREILRRATRLERGWNMNFTPPEGMMFRDICSQSGLLVTKGCRRDPDATIYEKMPFKKGTAPDQICSYH